MRIPSDYRNTTCIIAYPVRWAAKGDFVERQLRPFFIFVVTLLVVACGKPSPSLKGHWPGFAQSYEGFSEKESSGVNDAIADLNLQARRTIVSPEDNGGYPIRFVRVPKQSQNPQYGGLATPKGDHCLIELTDTLFAQNDTSYIQSVVWHEIGHCAGFDHAKSEHEVMSAVTAPFSEFGTDALERFLTRIASLMTF